MAYTSSVPFLSPNTTWEGGWVGWEWMGGWLGMGGWLHEWVVAWMGGCMDGWLHGWVVAWMGGCMDGWLHRWVVA